MALKAPQLSYYLGIRQTPMHSENMIEINARFFAQNVVRFFKNSMKSKHVIEVLSDPIEKPYSPKFVL